MNQHILQAINNLNLIQFQYDGGTRIVEPHCYGITTKDNEVVRAYQIAGESSSEVIGFKLFDLGKATSIQKLDERFKGPRPGYNKGDRGMKQIFGEL